MPFDPAQPASNSALSSQVMRDQLTSLKALIDAIVNIISAQVDSVTTLNPGDPATMSVSIINNELHFIVAIPRGNDGGQGMQGNPGSDGAPGAQGPPFALAVIDSVTTLAPGTPATVGVSFDGTNVHFAFGIPMGMQGPAGADGAPGEVTTAQLTADIATAVSGTSSNSNAIATLDTPFADPDAESMRQRFNELVLALRR